MLCSSTRAEVPLIRFRRFWEEPGVLQAECHRLLHSSRLTFTNPDSEDLGRYSVVVTDTDGVSASHTLTQDGRS